jgi:hypothetical protein
MPPRRFVRLFKPRFAPAVERWEKLQTIRPKPKRMPQPGDIISLRTWEGLPYRSKQRVLGEAVIASVEEIHLGELYLQRLNTTWIYGKRSGRKGGMDRFAQFDGFADWPDLVEWFRATHGIPFSGILVRWKRPDTSPAP